MDEAGFEALVERVYDMALEPDLWPSLLAHLMSAFGAHAGSLMQEDMESGRGGGVALGLDPTAPGLYFDYYSTRNVLRRLENPRERMKAFVPTITVDEETLPKRELMESEFYVDFLKPTGIHSVMTIGLWSRDVEFSGLDFYRPANRPSFGDDEVRLAAALHPHLIRGFRLGQRLAVTRDLNAGLSAGLDAAPLAAFVLDAEGRLRHANRAAERLLRQTKGFGVAMGRLVLRDAADNARLQALIAEAAGDGNGRMGGTIRVRQADGPALSVVAAPVDTGRQSPFDGGPGVVICVNDPDAVQVSVEQIADTFGLTVGQARVAQSLLSGRSARQIAEALGVSFFTVRAHLAQIFDKTGASRQAELVALMARRLGLGNGA